MKDCSLTYDDRVKRFCFFLIYLSMWKQLIKNEVNPAICLCDIVIPVQPTGNHQFVFILNFMAFIPSIRVWQHHRIRKVIHKPDILDKLTLDECLIVLMSLHILWMPKHIFGLLLNVCVCVCGACPPTYLDYFCVNIITVCFSKV